MALEIEVKDIKGKVVSTMSLSDEVFGIKGKDALLHEAVINFLANQRQGNHATKTKGFVSGGGKKPWKQKHTGRARAGSNRSPLWRGGGTIFGPLPRDYSYSMPKKQKRAALYAAISRKIADGEVFVVEEIKLSEPKTKLMAELIFGLGLSGKSLLIIDEAMDKNALLAARNMPAVRCMAASELNAYDVMVPDAVVVTKSAMGRLEAARA